MCVCVYVCVCMYDIYIFVRLFQLPLFWKILQIVPLTELSDTVQLPVYLLGDWMWSGCLQDSGPSLTGHLRERCPVGGWSVMIPVSPLCEDQKGLGSAVILYLLWHPLVTSLCPSLSWEGLSLVSNSNQQMFIRQLHWEPLRRCSEGHPTAPTVTSYQMCMQLISWPLRNLVYTTFELGIIPNLQMKKLRLWELSNWSLSQGGGTGI